MPVFKRFLVLSLIALLGACSYDPNVHVSTSWNIVGYDGPLEEKVVKPGDTIIQQGVAPMGLAVLSVDAPISKNKVVPAGTQLIQAKRGLDFKLFCSAVASTDPNALGEILLGLKDTYVCFEDLNGDKQFDHFYKVNSLFKGLLVFNQKLGKAKPVSASYLFAEPEELEQEYSVAIAYSGKPLLYDRYNFATRFGTPERINSLSRPQYVSGKALPQQLRMQGAIIQVVEETKDGLKVKIDNGMQPQPFTVYQITTYR